VREGHDDAGRAGDFFTSRMGAQHVATADNWYVEQFLPMQLSAIFARERTERRRAGNHQNDANQRTKQPGFLSPLGRLRERT